MTRDEFQKLAEDCHSLIQQGHKMEAIKRWRNRTGQGLASAKRNMDALESGDKLEFLSEVCPVLIKEYTAHVQQQLSTLNGLTVLESLGHVPTLKDYVKSELDRWYIIYENALAHSVFESTIINLQDFEPEDEVPKFGKNNKAYYGDGHLEEVVCNYAEVIKRISRHIKMLEQMKKDDFR